MSEQRNFARIDVDFRVRFQTLDAERAAAVRDEIFERPSVWAPNDEAGLLELASGSESETAGLLARAVLELSSEIVALRARVLSEGGGPMRTGKIRQLSGGGLQIATDAEIDFHTMIEVRFDDLAAGLPPVHCLVEVVHHAAQVPGYGCRFAAIHPHDLDRVIRFLYKIQRQALREAQSTNS